MNSHKSKNFTFEVGSALRRLLDLPVFSGMSADKFADIVGNTKFHFQKYKDGEMIVEKAASCTDLICVLSGSVRIVLGAENGFYLSQNLSAPAVVFPEYLFGQSNSCPAAVFACGETGTVQIAKNDFTSLLMKNSVILFNYLNIVATKAQVIDPELVTLICGSLLNRIANLVKNVTGKESHEIIIGSGDKHLSHYFGMNIEDFLQDINELCRTGYVKFDADGNRITVVSREKLVL